MFIGGLLRVNAGDTYPQGMVDRSHPVRVSPGQVIINRSQVAALTDKGIQVEGKGSHQGFTLTSFHLSNSTLVKDNAPHQLHIKVALTYSPLGGFTNSSKGLGQKLIKRSAGFIPSLKLIGLGTKLIITEFLKFRLQLIYLVYCRL
ncbi:hypothetical protein ES703_65291 [subsurface metagenome]